MQRYRRKKLNAEPTNGKNPSSANVVRVYSYFNCLFFLDLKYMFLLNKIEIHMVLSLTD